MANFFCVTVITNFFFLNEEAVIKNRFLVIIYGFFIWFAQLLVVDGRHVAEAAGRTEFSLFGNNLITAEQRVVNRVYELLWK